MTEEKKRQITQQMLLYYRDHLDIFIQDAFKPIKLSKTQHVIARQIGRMSDIKIVASRGFGKTWLTAVCVLALGVLYPGCPIATLSYTSMQAKLVIQKIKTLSSDNINISNQLKPSKNGVLVRLSKDGGSCELKNGSTITSYATDSFRGQRTKIVVLDQQRDMDRDVIASVVQPTKNFTRPNPTAYGYRDFASKTIGLTSATQKGTPFYDEFVRVMKRGLNPATGSFAIALDWHAAVEDGVNEQSFFLRQRQMIPQQQFAIQYGSIFLGQTAGSAFPFELTSPCRTLKKVQLCQPKNSKSRYALALDIATSEADYADNSIITVIKFTQHSNGTFSKKLVYIRSFHGKGLDVLANEIRILYHTKFPNIERIIFDARGLGDSFPKFLDTEWTDPTTGKEYPPLVQDDKPLYNQVALAVLHPVRAIQTLNQRIATNLRVSLEKKTLQLPINSRTMETQRLKEQNAVAMSLEEKSIFIQTDALQIQMGNVFPKVTQSGNVVYDCKVHQHKDRYSSLAYCNDYIAQLEKQNIKNKRSAEDCIGITSGFEDRGYLKASYQRF